MCVPFNRAGIEKLGDKIIYAYGNQAQNNNKK